MQRRGGANELTGESENPERKGMVKYRLTWKCTCFKLETHIRDECNKLGNFVEVSAIGVVSQNSNNRC